MDALIGIYLFPLVVESLLLLSFLYILATREIRRGRNLLLTVFIVILFFVIPTIVEAQRLITVSMPPPPEVWQEGYYDALSMRSWTFTKAAFDTIIIFVLSVSYICKKTLE